MAGGKGETAGAVSSRAGYRISRIEAPTPVEILRSNNAGSGYRRGGDSSEVEARNEQHQQAVRSRGGGRSGAKNNRGGKGRRGKRGGGEYQESVSSGAGTISARKDCSDRSVAFSKIGDWGGAVSPRRSSRNNQHQKQQQPRGGGPRKNQTHVNTLQIGGLPSSYLALPQDGRGRLHDVELGMSRGFTRAPREERQQVGRLQGFGRDNGEGSREKPNVGASSAIGSIGRERSTTARVGPYEGQRLRQSVGHQTHSSESSPRPSSGAVEGLSSRTGISGTRYSKASSSSSQHAKGTCMSMCPVEEARSREAEGALSVFEATDATAMLPFRERVADPNKTVKKYRRSAAGRDMHSPEQLRPLEVLQMTARYLVEVIFSQTCVKDGVDSASMTTGGIGHRGSSNTLKAYLFVEDRLRAVRQDMTVQGIALTAGAAVVLKTTANFYIVSEYLLCDEPADVFDRHLHTRELQGVFSSLAELFFQARGCLCPRDGLSSMIGMDEYLCLQAVHALVTAVRHCYKEDALIDAAARERGVGRVFTTTVSKLCGSSYGYGVDARLIKLDASFRKTFPKMAAAIHLLGAVGVGDWSEFHRVLGRRYPVDPLVGGEDAGSPFAVRLRCLCHGMLLPLRVHAVRAMNKSFGKGERVPLADLTRTLRMRDDAHAARLCRALSLPIQDETVTFKSVPAVWKTEDAQTNGFIPSPRAAESDWSANSMREDDWVGLDYVFSTARGRGCFGAVPLCEGCGGHGCSWCTEGDVSEEGGEGGRLWEAALAPV